MSRYEVIEVCSRLRTIGYGVRDADEDWLVEMFLFVEHGVGRARSVAEARADQLNVTSLPARSDLSRDIEAHDAAFTWAPATRADSDSEPDQGGR